jgi:hypothetical protein
MLKDAILSEPRGTYRYALWRIWDQSKPRPIFIGLNPSTADAENDDPTIRRCINFAKAWGGGGVIMLNLFAYRSTKPEGLHKVSDPIGPDNNKWLDFYTSKSNSVIIAAWGAGVKSSPIEQRDKHVLNRLTKYHQLYHLGLTKEGYPRHPLYVKGTTLPILLDY